MKNRLFRLLTPQDVEVRMNNSKNGYADLLVYKNARTDMDILTEKVASMSCKAAIKGNNKISYEEARELMEELMKADNPYNCPHGRPTLIVMSKYDIEKKFKRIV